MLVSRRALSRRALLAGFGLGGVALLAACSAGGSTAAPTSAPASSSAASTSSSAATTPAGAATSAKAAGTPAAVAQPAASSGTPVAFWIPWGQPERQKWAKKWGDAFHEKNPSQSVKVEFVGFGNMHQRWIAANQSKQMPEVLDTVFNELGTAHIAGATEAIDDVVKDLGGTNFFLEAPLSSWQYQGKYFGFPQYVFPRMLYYRKDLLEAKGLKNPTSWDEWLSNVVALTDPPNNKWGISMAVTDHSGEPIGYAMRSEGSAMFDKDGNPQLGTDAGYAAVDFYAKLIKQGGPPGTTNYTEDDQVKLFISRDTGYIITWPALLQWMVQQAPQHVKDLGAMLPPKKTTDPKPIATNIGYAMGKSPKNPDGAKLFLKFIIQSDPEMEFLHSIAGVFPVTKEVASSDKFLDNDIMKQFPEVNKISLEASNNGVEAGYLYGYNPGNSLALSTKPGISDMMQAIVLKNTPVKQAVDEQVKRENTAIAQFRR